MRLVGDAVILLDLAGELRGADVVTLQGMIFEAILGRLPDELVVNLDGVSFLSGEGRWVLVSGYVVAIEYGVSYRVVNARDQARSTLEVNRTLDVLADSDDLGALVAALLTLPAPHPA